MIPQLSHFQGITWGLWYWPAFLISVSLAFLAPESVAFFTNHANTLSDYSWLQLSVNSTGRHIFAWYASLIAWSVFTVVITAHIWFRWAG